MSGWLEAGARGAKIAHDFQAVPLQIMTDAPFGSSARLHIGLRRDAESSNTTGTGGVKIELSDPPKYFITFCSTDWTEFVTKCTQRIKTWTITRTNSSVIIECNRQVIASYQFATSERENCQLHWEESSGSFSFKKVSGGGGDTASKMYRTKPTTKTGMII